MTVEERLREQERINRDQSELILKISLALEKASGLILQHSDSILRLEEEVRILQSWNTPLK